MDETALYGSTGVARQNHTTPGTTTLVQIKHSTHTMAMRHADVNKPMTQTGTARKHGKTTN